MTIDASIFTQGALIAYGMVFLGGIVTSIGPCNLAMIPLVIGFVGGGREQYRIYRAPTLLLLDAQGREVWRQHDVSSEMQVFDLEAFETHIMMLADERAP